MSSFAAGAKNDRPTPPPRRIDLTSFWPGAIPPMLPRLRRVLFLNNSTLAIAAVVYGQKRPSLASRRAAGPAPYALQVALFEVATGRLLREARWPTSAPWNSGLLAVSNGAIFALLADHLARADESLQIVSEIALPGPAGTIWFAVASPGAERAWFAQDNELSGGLNALVDLEHLKIVASWINPHRRPGRSVETESPDAVGASLLAFTLCHNGGPPCLVAVRATPAGPDLAHIGIDYQQARPSFVGDDLVVAPKAPNGCAILDTRQRRVIFTRGFGFSNSICGAALASPAAARIVIPVVSRGRHDALERLLILDPPYDRALALDARGSAPLEWQWRGFARTRAWLALSPNGRTLAAMISARTVLLFSLPPATVPNAQATGRR